MTTQELRQKLTRLATERDKLHERIAADTATLAALAAEGKPAADRLATRRHRAGLEAEHEEALLGIEKVKSLLAQAEARDRERQLSEAREAAGAALSRRDSAAEAVAEHYRKVAAEHAPLSDELSEANAEVLRTHREVLRLEGADNYTIYHAYPPARGRRIPSGSEQLARDGGAKRVQRVGPALPQQPANPMNLPEPRKDPLTP